MNTDDVEVEIELGKINNGSLIAESRSMKSLFGLVSILEKVVDSKFFSGFGGSTRGPGPNGRETVRLVFVTSWADCDFSRRLVDETEIDLDSSENSVDFETFEVSKLTKVFVVSCIIAAEFLVG